MQHLAQLDELAWKAVDAMPALRVGLGLQAVDEAVVQALDQQLEFAGQRLLRADAVQRHGVAPDRGALVLVQRCKRLREAGQQIAFGDQQVDRESHRQLFVQLLHAGANGLGMARAIGRTLGDQVRHRHRHQHPVQGLARAGFLQHLQEAAPGRLVVGGVAVLGDEAAGGVDQHRGVGEPPVAIARAAHAANGLIAHLVGEREAQARVAQRRGLARAWCADDRVPGQLVEKASAERLVDALPERRLGRCTGPIDTEAGIAQGLQRGLETLPNRHHVGAFGRCRRAACRTGHQLVDHLAVATARLPHLPADDERHGEQQHGGGDPSRGGAVQRPPFADRHQWADVPQHQERQRQQHCQQSPAVEQETEERLHRSGSASGMRPARAPARSRASHSRRHPAAP